MSMKVLSPRDPARATADGAPGTPAGPEGARSPFGSPRKLAIAGVVAALTLGVLGAIAALALGSSGAPAVVAPPSIRGPSSPAALTCKVGFYVESLHDGNVTAGTFNADVWAWSVCPTSSLKPLDSVEFTSANSVQKSFATTTTEPDGSEYSSMRVTGQFRHAYGLADYPFDRQRLEIPFEDSSADSSQLWYRPDRANTGCAPQLTLEDWKVSRCSLMVAAHQYVTNFGDPQVPSGTAHTYGRGVLVISLARSQPATEYLKATSIIYPSVLLIIISFFLLTEATNTLGARMSTAGGALFAIALNMKALSSQLNADNHFTLMDAIGLFALVAVVFAGGTAMWCQRRLDRGIAFARVRAVSHRLGWSVLAVFLGVNGLLVALAMH
jgi:hypothetical protein